MRSDVKIGLICVFAIVLAVVIYFVFQGNARPHTAAAGTPTGAATPHNDPAPIPAASPAAAPVASPGPVLASVGGPLIGPPGSGSPSGGAAATAPSTPGMGGSSGSGGSALGGGVPVTSGSGSSNPLTPPILPRSGLSGGASSGGISSTSGTDTLQLGGGGSVPMPGSGGTGVGGPGSTLGGGSGISRSGPTTYKIVQGDMLGTIAKKFSVTVKAIETANPGIDSTRLKVNSTINIPAPTPTVASTRPATSRPATSRPASGIASSSPSAKPGSSYVVKHGDTLSTIARAAYGDKGSWKKIFEANKSEIPDPNVVAVGTELKIPQ